MIGDKDEHDPVSEPLGAYVERIETSLTVYLSSIDPVSFVERLDDYLGDPSWTAMTIDRSNDGLFYAFFIRKYN